MMDLKKLEESSSVPTKETFLSDAPEKTPYTKFAK
jgi:hypothetical protein